MGNFSDKTVSYMQDVNDTEIAAILWADLDGTNFAPTIQGSSADLLATTDGTAVAAAFTDIGAGTAGTIDTAQTDVDTMGELADRINEGCAGWNMELISALRADTSDYILDTITEAQCGGRENAVVIPYDTTDRKKYQIGLTPRRWAHFDSGEPGSDGEYINEILYLGCESNFASGTSIVNIYEVDHRKAGVAARLMFTYPLTDDTAFTLEDYNLPIQSAMGKSLVVVLANSTQVIDAHINVKARHFIGNPGLRRG